jgi:pimeloyl-ACP methyl ester carboxylesterase
MSFFLGHRRTNRPLWRRLPRMARFGLRLLLDQEGLLFQPRRELRGSPADVGLAFEEVSLPGGLRGWWIPGPPQAPAVLFLPGAIGNLGGELPTLRFLRSLGAGVLAVDYPGYGRSEGRPSLDGCHRAAAEGWRFLAETAGAPRLVVYGRSLGCFFAARLAASRPAAGLVFHNGFSSVADMAARVFHPALVRLLCRVQLSSVEDLARRRCPALFLHALRDEVIPMGLGRRAWEAAAGPRLFLEVAGGHFDDDWQNDPRVRAAFREVLAGETAGWEAAA